MFQSPSGLSLFFIEQKRKGKRPAAIQQLGTSSLRKMVRRTSGNSFKCSLKSSFLYFRIKFIHFLVLYLIELSVSKNETIILTWGNVFRRENSKMYVFKSLAIHFIIVLFNLNFSVLLKLNALPTNGAFEQNISPCRREINYITLQF